MFRSKTVAFILGAFLLAVLAGPAWAAPTSGADLGISSVLAWLDQLVGFFSSESTSSEAGVVDRPGAHNQPGLAAQTGKSGVFVDPGGQPVPPGSAMEGGVFVDPGGSTQTAEEPPTDEAGGFADPGG